jgi:hypothetical protein
MGYDPVAKLFYGYIQARDEYDNLPRGSQDWGELYKLDKDSPCGFELFGYDGFIYYAFIIKQSIVRAEWSQSKLLHPNHLFVKPNWDTTLLTQAKLLGLYVEGLEPNWYLVSLYF